MFEKLGWSFPCYRSIYKPDINPFVVMRRAQNGAVILTVVTPGIPRGPAGKICIFNGVMPDPPIEDIDYTCKATLNTEHSHTFPRDQSP